MKTMEKGNIFDQMDNFDFKKPINVTVILEESEENTCTDVPVEEKPCNQNARSIDTPILQTDKEISKSKFKRNSTESMERTYCLIKEQFQIREQNTLESNLIHNNIKTTGTGLDKRKLDEMNLPTNAKIRCQNQGGLNCNHNGKNSFKEKETIKNVTMDGDSIRSKNTHKTPVINYKVNESNNNRIMSTVADSLKPVSENLIYIFKIFRYMRENRLYHKETFTCEKHHLFSLSYHTVVAVLLPQEKNEKFITNFLNSTLKLAGDKNLCSYRQLEFLFFDMIAWTKRKKKFLSLDVHNKTINTMSNNNLIDELSKSVPLHFTNGNNIINSNNNLNNVNVSSEGFKTRIFTVGSPGQEVTIDINSKLMNCHNTPVNNVCTFDTLSSERNNSNYVEDQHNYLHMLQNSIENVSCETPILRYHNQSRPGHSNPIHMHFQDSSLSQNNVFSNIDIASHNCSNNHRSTYEQNEPRIENWPIMSSLLRESQSNKSILCSRDENAPMINERHAEQVEQNHQSTPLITHVTSLNPKTTYISDGLCHVCRKTTKQMCIGCYKYYYCSYECQVSDWNFHMGLCGKANKNSEDTFKIWQ